MKFPWWKLIVGYLLFVFFHQLIYIIPGTLVGNLFSEGIESVYPHMKMLFYAYLVVSVIDYFLRRKDINLESFLYARMLILSAVPWMMIAIYYSLEAIGIDLPMLVELIWGLIMTGVGVYICIRLEEPLDNVSLRGAAKAVILLAFVGTLLTYVGFSFHVPDNFFYVDR